MRLKSIWLRLCRPRGKAGVGLWGFLWVFAGSGGPWRLSLGGVLIAFGKRKDSNTRFEIADLRRVWRQVDRQGPKSVPEITDSRAV